MPYILAGNKVPLTSLMLMTRLFPRRPHDLQLPTSPWRRKRLKDQGTSTVHIDPWMIHNRDPWPGGLLKRAWESKWPISWRKMLHPWGRCRVRRETGTEKEGAVLLSPTECLSNSLYIKWSWVPNSAVKKKTANVARSKTSESIRTQRILFFFF